MGTTVNNNAKDIVNKTKAKELQHNPNGSATGAAAYTDAKNKAQTATGASTAKVINANQNQKKIAAKKAKQQIVLDPKEKPLDAERKTNLAYNKYSKSDMDKLSNAGASLSPTASENKTVAEKSAVVEGNGKITGDSSDDKKAETKMSDIDNFTGTDYHENKEVPEGKIKTFADISMIKPAVASDKAVDKVTSLAGVKKDADTNDKKIDTSKLKVKAKIKTNMPILKPMGNMIKLGLGRLDSPQDKLMMMSAYNKFKIVHPNLHNGYRRMHIFMTTPTCNLRNDNTSSSHNITARVSDELLKGDLRLAAYIADNDTNMALAGFLSYSSGVSSAVRTPWMFPLMNFTTGISSIPSFDFKTRQGPSNTLGQAMDLPFALIPGGNTASLSFQDDRNAIIARIMYIWTSYISDVNLGKVTPRKGDIIGRRLDYTSTIYVFLTDETGSKLDYWFRLIGVYPKGRNYDYLDLSKSIVLGADGGSISVSFNVGDIEDMHPSILDDFNMISKVYDNIDPGESSKVEQTWDAHNKNTGLSKWYHNKFFIARHQVTGDYHLMSYGDKDLRDTSTQLMNRYQTQATETTKNIGK